MYIKCTLVFHILYIFCGCVRIARSAARLNLATSTAQIRILLLATVSISETNQIVPAMVCIQWRVQQCERFQALVVLVSGFTHYE